MSDKNTFQKIIDICEQNTDAEGTLHEIKIKAKNRVIRFEWEENYGIKLDEYCKLGESDCHNISDYSFIAYYRDGYKDHKESIGRHIFSPEGGKQPVDEWLYVTNFCMGAYIFGDDYPSELFQGFLKELRSYKPDYEDLFNHELYWKIENAKEIMSQFTKILNKYKDLERADLKRREITKLEAQLLKLKGQA